MEAAENVWTEPIIGQNGQIIYRTPPRPVLEFIENPAPENAEAYLAWNRQRFESCLKAQEVLRKVMEKQEGEGAVREAKLL